MPVRRPLLAPAAVAALVACAGCQAAGPGTPAEGAERVVAVVDGDTLQVDGPAGSRRVRLLGVDAPELAHDGRREECGAAAARDALAELTRGRRVRVVLDPAADQRDRFGRTLAYVEVDGADVGARLVGAGWAGAWAPASAPRPSRLEEYRQLRAQARAHRRGSWAQCRRVGRR